ncbi:MAG: Bifunctional phosphoglucose/phosphomannose isomerase [Candidatus Woesebacteria bacterium GW2011_GWB1_40_101]|uniref:Bifunctional phosphoglucose/phosphomannose isomerase n=1 Tax=Candidatus Woesebacteria bacterium GW2011_GWB1_40_101 TaxID=1618575 RepID=A0A0G0QFX8_9BACT|nr:MAG: Bifunctional phosphoglucose/phosphomannose isomerase [Candidatus Woesebacteria bacterium GW2011_GWB1_40_101]
MTNLDSKEDIEKLDKGGILKSIELIPDQFTQAWKEIEESKLPTGASVTQNVVICGMGGSALGGRAVDSVVYGRARVPIEVFNEYKIPNYVNSDSFVIISSYSGNTEETLSCAKLALTKGAKIFGITTGGKLAEFLKRNKLAAYVFNPKYNPSGQPRMGLGYSIAAIYALLIKCGLVRYSNEKEHIVFTLKKYIDEYNVNIPENGNLAKTFARKLLHKVVILMASEHLVGVTHGFANQLNENSKTFSTTFDLPEANHHLIEGLRFPAKAKDLLSFLFMESKHYTPEVQKRYPITKEVFKINGYPSLGYVTSSEDAILEIFEVLVFGSFVSFYLAMLNGVDPTPIPWVDYFKAQLVR